MKVKFPFLINILLMLLMTNVIAQNINEPFVIDFDQTSGVYVDYEDTDVVSEFIDVGGVSNPMAYGFSFINPSTKMMVVESSLNDKQALRISEFSDLRIWSLNIYSEDFFRVQATFKFNSVESSEALLLCVTAAESENKELPNTTNSEATNGRLFVISADENGNPILNNNANELVTTLEKGKVYTIGVVIKAQTDKYDITVNDKVLSTDNTFPSLVDAIKSARLDVRGTNTDVLVDDLIISSAENYSIGEPVATATEEPTTTPEPTSKPAKTIAVAPTTKAAGTSSNSTGKPIIIISIIAIIVVIAVILVLLVVHKNKKMRG